jgi:putative proteasome-type protease
MAKDIAKQTKVNLNTVADVNEAADYVGQISVEQQHKTGGGAAYEASFLLGGQVIGNPPQLTLIYPQGNHISTSRQTPFWFSGIFGGSQIE